MVLVTTLILLPEFHVGPGTSMLTRAGEWQYQVHCRYTNVCTSYMVRSQEFQGVAV